MEQPFTVDRQQIVDEIRCRMKQHQEFNEDFLLLLSELRMQYDLVELEARLMDESQPQSIGRVVRQFMSRMAAGLSRRAHSPGHAPTIDGIYIVSESDTNAVPTNSIQRKGKGL